jgi:hypothetical protein
MQKKNVKIETKIVKIYEYIYYRTYFVISKTNSISPSYSSASLLSITFLLNVFTIYFFLKEPFEMIGFYFFLSIGIAISFLNLRYFLDEIKIKSINSEYENLKVNRLWNYLIDSYPWLSILIFLLSAGANYNTIFTFVAIFIILRLFEFFTKCK